MKRTILYFTLVFAGFFVSRAQEASVLELNEAIGLAMENNFQVLLARNNADISQNNNTLGNAGFLPVVSANANLQRNLQNTDQVFASGSTQSRDGAQRKASGASIGLVWTLFDGTRMFATKNRLEDQALFDFYQMKVQVDNTLRNVMSVYYQLAFEQERLQLFESNLAFSADRIRIVEEKYLLGKESKLSLLQARVDYNADQSLLVQQNELLAARKLELIRLMGVGPFDFQAVYEVQPDSTLLVGELLDMAYSQNPMLRARQINQEVVQNQLRELNRSRWPVVDFNLGYGKSNLNSQAGFLLSNRTSDLAYGLSARVNIFDGFNLNRQVENARIQLENSLIQEQEVESIIETSLLTTYTSYQNNLSLAALELQNLDVATENSDIALERFRLGVSDALQLRQAQINAVNAQVRFLLAQLSAKLAEIDLKHLSGMLSTVQE